MDSDSKNFILFIILSFAIILTWQLFMAPKPKPGAPGQHLATAPAGPTQAPAAPGAAPSPAAAPAAQPAPALNAAPGAEVLPETPTVPEKKVTVKNGVYEIVFSTRGAVPVSWQLLKYQDAVYFPYEVNLVWPPLKKIQPFQPKPVNLVNPQLASGLEPFRTEIHLDNLVIPEHASWETDVEQLQVSDADQSQTLAFRLRTGSGALITKSYTFRPLDYSVELNLSIAPGPGAGPAAKAEVLTRLSFLYESGNRLTRVNFHGPLSYAGEKQAEKLHQVKVDDLLKKGPVEQDGVLWAGFSDSYFLTALLPAEPAQTLDWTTRYSGPEDLRLDKKAAKELSGELRAVPTPEELARGELLKLRLFVGPKAADILAKANPKLPMAIDYGMLYIVVWPLMWALNQLYRFLPNYGVCIIVLTVALRMGMFPLTRKGQQSMKEMQKLQPEMQKIKERYPNDRMKQQEEMASLYKKYKINPIGGCLPMLLQIPVFFAFYKALLISIELRHAPFFSWIQDLSGRDPLLIWPLLMGGTQILMQKMTPTTSVDPTQAKMMMLMPLVFIFLLLYFPAGLIIYWTCSNLVGIGQQIYVNRKS